MELTRVLWNPAAARNLQRRLTRTLPVVGLVAASCTASSEAPLAPVSSSAAAASPSVSPGVVLPSAPAGATVVHTAAAELRLGRTRGILAVIVKATTTPTATKVEARYLREVDCRTEPSGIGGCRTLYDVRRPVPPSAYTYDATMDRSSFTATVEGKPLTISWVGFGEVRRQVNTAGALVIDMRDAAADSRWGTFRQRDPQTSDTPAMLGRRVHAPA